MERLRQRLSVASRALDSLAELVGQEVPGAVERDAAIQRFEYSFEAVWKAAQRFLLVLEGTTVGSPKASIRSSGDVGLMDRAAVAQALEMADDRNLTVHTYNEELARAIYSRLDRHTRTLRAWLDDMNARADLSEE